MTRRHGVRVLLVLVVVAAVVPAAAADSVPQGGGYHHVDPLLGDDLAGSGAADRPFRTIGRALTDAMTGETVLLHPGTYDEAVVTVRPGVTVAGPRTAVLRGDSSSGRLFEVHHDDTTLSGFTIDGKVRRAGGVVPPRQGRLRDGHVATLSATTQTGSVTRPRAADAAPATAIGA